MQIPFSSGVCAAAAMLALSTAARAREPETGGEAPPPPASAPAEASEPPSASFDSVPASPPAAAPAPATAPQSAAAPAPDTGVEDLAWPERPERTRRTHDAHADRVILFPTAETHPEGSFFISSYELFLIQLGYAVSDDFQMSALFLPPIVKDQPFFISPTFKLNVLRSEQGNVALLGGFDIVSDDGDGTVLGRLGAAGQLCFDPACNSSVTVNGHGWTEIGDSQGSVVLLSAGGLFRASNLVSILIEPSYALLLRDGDIDTPEGFLLAYGVRFSGKQFGLDITFARPFFEDVGDELLLGIPFVVASYRSD